jgi:hypothetical protein
MKGIEARVRSALEQHPGVQAVRLAGSRQRGTPTRLSDWDFVVETSDFDRVAQDLPDLVSPLNPVAQQWDPLSDHACYTFLLRGPVKIDLLFAEARQPDPPWSPGPETLEAIDAHFWDWSLWLASKDEAGNSGLVSSELAKMHWFLLAPLGVPAVPASVADAVRSYRDARDQAEQRWGVSLSRELESEVATVLSDR